MATTNQGWVKLEEKLRERFANETPLDTYVICKRLMKALDFYLDASMEGANVEFQQNHPKEVLGCELKNYTPRTAWKYSNEIIEMELELKKRKKVEELTGVAEKLESEKEHILFTVKARPFMKQKDDDSSFME